MKFPHLIAGHACSIYWQTGKFQQSMEYFGAYIFHFHLCILDIYDCFCLLLFYYSFYVLQIAFFSIEIETEALCFQPWISYKWRGVPIELRPGRPNYIFFNGFCKFLSTNLLVGSILFLYQQ